MPVQWGRDALDDLAARGFTRRHVLRVAALVSAAAALPLGSERALAQLSDAGALPADAVKINANEFPEGPSERALAALAEAARQGNRYQYPETEALVGPPRRSSDWDPNTSRCTPASLALHHAVIAFTSPARALVVAEPGGYEAAAFAATFIGAPVVRVPLRADAAHDLPAMLAASEATRRPVLRVQPEQPDRHGDPRAAIDALVARCAARLRGLARRGVHPPV